MVVDDNLRSKYSVENLKQVLMSISDKSNLAWVYLPADRNWSLKSPCLVLESEEVPPELEDEPDAGIPVIATQNNMIEVLPVSDVQDIVENARAQKQNLCDDDLFAAFIFYYKNDAFIIF